MSLSAGLKRGCVYGMGNEITSLHSLILRHSHLPCVVKPQCWCCRTVTPVGTSTSTSPEPSQTVQPQLPVTKHSVSQGTQYRAFSCSSGRTGAVKQKLCTVKIDFMPNMNNFFQVCKTERERTFSNQVTTLVADVVLKCSNCISLKFHLMHVNVSSVSML